MHQSCSCLWLKAETYTSHSATTNKAGVTLKLGHQLLQSHVGYGWLESCPPPIPFSNTKLYALPTKKSLPLKRWAKNQNPFKVYVFQKFFPPVERQWENKLCVAHLHSVVSSVTYGSDPKCRRDETVKMWGKKRKYSEERLRRDFSQTVVCLKALLKLRNY